MKRIRTIQKLVEHLLIEFPETRDNDRLLMFKVWAEQNPKIRTEEYLLWDFAKEFIEHSKFSDPETIRRTRQKIQEKNSNLRGSSYGNRHCLSAQMRKEINNPKLFDN